jgi:hypothetical protein
MTPQGLYRVAHYGTGDTGSQALRGVIARPEFHLVAHLVHSPNKAGLDSGEIVGVRPVGVRATTDFAEFLRVDADCVTYFATDFGRDPDDVIGEMCAILASGKNLVTSTMPLLAYPTALPNDVAERLEAACQAGGSSFFCTGIAPGFTTDALVLTCSSLCARVDSVVVSERIYMGTYSDPMSFEFLGFGRTPADDAAIPRAELSSDSFSSTFAMLGDGLGMTFDDVTAHRAVAVADADYTCAAGPIPEGTIASVRLGFDGLVKGEPRVTVTIIYSMIEVVVDPWEPQVPRSERFGSRLTYLAVRGAPTVDVRLSLSGTEQPGVDATAARVVNSIGVTVAAAVGMHSPLDLPVWGDQTFKP